MTTSPHLAPTSPQPEGRPHRATSPLAPLPVGGEVALEPTSPPPHKHDLAPANGASSPITAHCPTHGRQPFIYSHAGAMHVCPQLVEFHQDGTVDFCGSVILDEHVTPDGADVVDVRQALPLGQQCTIWTSGR